MATINGQLFFFLLGIWNLGKIFISKQISNFNIGGRYLIKPNIGANLLGLIDQQDKTWAEFSALEGAVCVCHAVLIL
jgi:hypothetical protein